GPPGRRDRRLDACAGLDAAHRPGRRHADPERQARRHPQHGRRRGGEFRQHPRTPADLNTDEAVSAAPCPDLFRAPTSSLLERKERRGWPGQARPRGSKGGRLMAEFRALVLHEEGGKVVPRLESVDEARLPPGEVTVAVEYSTLNYKDGMILEGQGRLERAYPHVPGVDFAGTVLRSDSPEFRPGDPVTLTGWPVGE